MTQAISVRKSLDFKFTWLFSREYDLFVFAFPCVLAIALMISSFSGLVIATTCAFIVTELFPMVGTLHGGASWFHYWDPTNRAHFFGTTKRLLIFLIAPIAIMLLSIVGYTCHLASVVFLVYMFWTVQHLAQQNVGILLLYHNSGEAVVPRKIEARTLQIPAALFGALFIVHLATDGPKFIACAVFCVCFCVLLCCNYIWHLYQQAQSGAYVNLSALCFWLLSVWFFLPLALLKQSYFQAMLVPLFVHWCQYLGLNYVLVARKYEAENRSRVFVRRPMVAFIGICTAITVVITGAGYLSEFLKFEIWKQALAGLVIGFSLTHYFQDAFLWRFRDQFQRQSILPYIKQR